MAGTRYEAHWWQAFILSLASAMRYLRDHECIWRKRCSVRVVYRCPITACMYVRDHTTYSHPGYFSTILHCQYHTQRQEEGFC